MVIVAAAAVGAAAVGLYHGGKTAVHQTEKVFTERSERNQRNKQRREEQKQREADAEYLKSLSFKERLAFCKRDNGLPSVSNQRKKRFLISNNPQK
jgi:phosphosulfolactate phosphohydrolase-like enzyme